MLLLRPSQRNGLSSSSGSKLTVRASRSRLRQAVAATLVVGAPRAARHRDSPGPHHLEDAIRPQHVEQAVDLVLGARDLDDQRFGRDVDDARAEDVDELHHFAARGLRRRDLDHREIAIDRLARRQRLDPLDVDQLVEVGLDALRAALGVSTTIVIRDTPGRSV